MYVLIIIIYIILLSFIEVSSFIFKKKQLNFVELYSELPKEIKLTEIFEEKEDVEIDNFIGYLSIKNNYGFYIKDSTWNILKIGKYYKFNIPVNIKIINLGKLKLYKN